MLPAAVISEITAYATLVTAIATGALAYLTYRLAWESRSLRKAGSEPRVVAYFEPHPDGHGGVNFVIANYGLGPAFEVDFKFHNDAKDFETHEVLLTNDSKPNAVHSCAARAKISSSFWRWLCFVFG